MMMMMNSAKPEITNLTPWSRALDISSPGQKNPPLFMDSDGSLPSSEDPASDPHLEPHEYSTDSHNMVI
jgi:hypothetical protein